MGVLLARSRADFPAIQAEFRSRMATVDLSGTEFKTASAEAETLFATFARLLLRTGPSRAVVGRGAGPGGFVTKLVLVLSGLALAFMALPALNLVNLSVSRALERAGEIGVRRAFGASRAALVGQFVLENVILTLIGGVDRARRDGGGLARPDRERPRPVRRLPPQLADLRLGALLRPRVRRAVRRLAGLAPVPPPPRGGVAGRDAMIRHLLKMVWARRRANGLVAAEILVSFVVLLAVTTLGLYYLDNYRQPVGFDHRDVWRLEMDPGRPPRGEACGGRRAGERGGDARSR